MNLKDSICSSFDRWCNVRPRSGIMNVFSANCFVMISAITQLQRQHACQKWCESCTLRPIFIFFKRWFQHVSRFFSFMFIVFRCHRVVVQCFVVVLTGIGCPAAREQTLFSETSLFILENTLSGCFSLLFQKYSQLPCRLSRWHALTLT